jgi:2-C-methyl-D-erythritol 4-phosphate cytidylyltransferase
MDFEIADGGKTRFDSVKNGLNEISDEKGIVFIHDAARPLVSKETIARCFEAAKKTGNAIPVLKVNESLRKVSGEDSFPLNRDEIRIVQTPQCFSIPEIKKAFEQEYDVAFTDDASVLEKEGKKINLVDGNQENIKITFPADLSYAEYILKNISQ